MTNFAPAVAAKGSASGLILMTIYAGLVAAGTVVAYLIGTRVEAAYPEASLPFFVAEFLGVVLLAGPIAMRFTPDDPPEEAGSPPESRNAVEKSA